MDLKHKVNKYFWRLYALKMFLANFKFILAKFPASPGQSAMEMVSYA
jgi:hypothetical protein